MKTTKNTARIAELIAADKIEEVAAKNYTRTMNEGGEGYNPHEVRREEIGSELSKLWQADRRERIAAITAAETAEIRDWMNAQKFQHAGFANVGLQKKYDITLDDLKSLIAR